MPKRLGIYEPAMNAISSKPVAKYEGGIQERVQAAVRNDGQVFRRYQSKGAYGYVWSAWRQAERISTAAMPLSLSSGFSTLFKVDGDTYRNFPCRLPKT